MANLTVIIFDDPDQAGELKEGLKKEEHEGLIKVDDTAVVVKDADGKVHTDKQFLDSGTKRGAVAGGVIGLVLLGLFAPVLGIAGGALIGGIVGKSANKGISKKFVEDVEKELKPNTSALFVMTEDANAAAVAGLLREYHGKIYQTTLPSDVAEELQNALDSNQNQQVNHPH